MIREAKHKLVTHPLMVMLLIAAENVRRSAMGSGTVSHYHSFTFHLLHTMGYPHHTLLLYLYCISWLICTAINNKNNKLLDDFERRRRNMCSSCLVILWLPLYSSCLGVFTAVVVVIDSGVTQLALAPSAVISTLTHHLLSCPSDGEKLSPSFSQNMRVLASLHIQMTVQNNIK